MQILLFAISLFLFTFLYLFVLLLLFWSETFGKKKSQFIFWILKINRKYCLNQPFEHIFLWFHLSNCGWWVLLTIYSSFSLFYTPTICIISFSQTHRISNERDFRVTIMTHEMTLFTSACLHSYSFMKHPSALLCLMLKILKQRLECCRWAYFPNYILTQTHSHK